MKKRVSRELLAVIFGENIPDFFLENLRLQRIEDNLHAFKLVAVLPLGRRQNNRITWSSLGEEDDWLAVVSTLLPPNQRERLRCFPAETRKVLDFDGQWGEIFLDDLHRERETQQMCSIFDLEGKEVAIIRKIESPLREKLSSSILFHPCFLGCLSIGGMWGIRESIRSEVLSVLWVSEAKWKGNIRQVQELVDSHNPPAEWGELKEIASENGMEAYPDGIEFFENGRIDLSITFTAEHGG